METFPYCHMTINSKKELPLLRTSQYGSSKNYTILPTVHKQRLCGKPQIVLDNYLTALVISGSSLLPS